MLRTLSILFVSSIFLWSSCSTDDSSIDDDLRFSINTSENSRGLSYYTMPGSNEYSRIPQDLRNPLTPEKVNLGRMLFHESVFGTAGIIEDHAKTYSCASCHHSAAGFQAGMMQGIGEGGIGFGIAGEGRKVDFDVAMGDIDVQPVRTPSALNIAYQTNVLWNGQFGATALNAGTEDLWPDGTPIAVNRLGYEGVETQAIAGIAVHRLEFTEETITENGYKEYFDQAFSRVPERRRYTDEMAGLALAAYERTLLANQSPFQQWLRGSEAAMTEAQKEGARLFFGKAECNNCHYGPSLAAMEFHAIGMKDFDPTMVANFKEDDPSKLGRASFTKRAEDEYKFKVPQLYNLKNSPFYGHGGSFTSVREVIEYKNQAIAENGEVRKDQLSPYFHPLGLDEVEIDLLTDFVENALYDPHLERYDPDAILSGYCFPNNDYLSKQDLGCE